MKIYIRIVIFTLFIFTAWFSIIAQPEQQEFSVEGTDGKWFADSAERSKNAGIEEILGRKSLVIKKGSHIVRSGIEFTDGTIEFDVAPLDNSQFIVVMFRRENFQNFENIYLRPSQSGNYQALQYAPVINGGSTWQLYPEFNRTIELPENKWTHVKIEVSGGNLKIFINNSAEPTLEVARLRGIPEKGNVGFWSRVRDRDSEDWATAFSNITISPSNSAASKKINYPKPPPGILDEWQVSEPLENKEGAVMNLPNLKGWKPARAEESGLINLSRAMGIRPGRWTAFAKTSIKSEAAKTALLEFGYSDDVTIFLNGEPVFSGINGWQSRYPGYMGFAKLGNDRVFLKLKPGDNELVFAVSDQRFGWGFVAQLEYLQ